MGSLSKRDMLIIFPFFMFFSLFTPFAFGIILLALAPYLRIRPVLLIGSILVIYAFFIMNSNKAITNDLYWYSQHYMMNDGASIYDVFSGYRAGVEARWVEPLYHMFSYVISNATGANYNVFVFFVSFSIYLGSLFAVFSFIDKTDLNESNKAIIIIFFLFLGIIFTQSLHLIRQYLACTLLLNCIVLCINKKYRLAFVFSLLAFLTHNSTFIISILFFIIFYINNHAQNIKIKVISVSLLSIILGGVYIVLFIVTGNESRLLIDDGSVSAVVKGIDFLLFIITIGAFYFSKNKNRETELIFLFYLSFCLFLFILHYSHFLSLRYYFFLDFIRWVPCYIFLNKFTLNNSDRLIVGLGLMAVCIGYFNVRLTNSPFDYKYNFFEYLVYSFI